MNVTDLPNQENKLFNCTFLCEISDMVSSWLYPKNIGAAAQFLEYQLESDRRVVLYGAGTHSQLLWERLAKVTQGKIFRVLDQLPEGRGFPVSVQHPHKFLEGGEPYDRIILSHFDFESSMLETLHGLGVPDNKILPIYINPDYFSSLSEPGELPFISKEERQGKQVIVFVTLRGNRRILNDAVIEELVRDPEFVFVNLDMGRDKTVRRELYTSYFDCQRSIVQMVQALESLRPDLVYVHDQIETLYFLPRLLMNCIPGVPVVWEPYDLLHLMIDDYSVLGRDKGLSEAEIAFTQDNERYALKHSAGVVYKELGPLATHVYHNERQGPSLHFNQYLGADLLCTSDQVLEQPYRLVYAGTIDPSGQDNVFTGDNYLLGEFEKLLSQGLRLDIYLNCDEQGIDTLYQNYQQLERQFTDFRLHPRQQLEKLIPRLAEDFHFGIQIGRCDARMLKVNRRRYCSTFSAKLWTYLFAGLPVIVNEELEGMAAFVREHDVGLVVSCRSHSELVQLLDSIFPERYLELKINVQHLANKSCAQQMAPLLSHFVKQFHGKKSC